MGLELSWKSREAHFPVMPGLTLPSSCRLFQNTSLAILEVCTLYMLVTGTWCCRGALYVYTEGLYIVGYRNYQGRL